MSNLLHSDVTQQVIGAAYEVHSALGPGYLETVYEAAMDHELQLRGLAVSRQTRIPTIYKKKEISFHVLDLLVNNCVIVELKAITELNDVHRGTLISYLTAAKLNVGLLINFGQPKLNYKRVVRTTRTP